jgi:hypothetical protein
VYAKKEKFANIFNRVCKFEFLNFKIDFQNPFALSLSCLPIMMRKTILSFTYAAFARHYDTMSKAKKSKRDICGETIITFSSSSSLPSSSSFVLFLRLK